ncbi:hypothetical protein BZG36_02945 [Bifiguratus adelaidae]|uniref:N-acetyltransferase domain-containing protein n=1 Tax=Bifiguratus adelaidae TaxID=1938954 RepID=A0A261Y031_9FUNG|nr:hypothetical protein BZG36_02945 [Bifiguratus adelaidae]
MTRDSDSDNFALLHPTPAQLAIVNKSVVSWMATNHGINDHFQRKEHANRLSPNGHRDRILVFKEDATSRPGDPIIPILSDYQTYLHKVWVKLPGSRNVEEAWIEGISNVYTPQEHRRHGCASTMPFKRKRMAKPTASGQKPSCPTFTWTVEKFYEPIGWKTYPAPEVFPLDDRQPGEGFETRLANSLEWISDDELPSIIEEDRRILLDEVAARGTQYPSSAWFQQPKHFSGNKVACACTLQRLGYQTSGTVESESPVPQTWRSGSTFSRTSSS